MIEREMEDLLWMYPEAFFGEILQPLERQPHSAIGRADLIFKDSLNRLLVVEVKHGTLPRNAIHQIEDYYGYAKQKFPENSVEKMVVANIIPRERRIACEQYNIECREIPEKRFRDVAHENGYRFESEFRQDQCETPRDEPRLTADRQEHATRNDSDVSFARNDVRNSYKRRAIAGNLTGLPQIAYEVLHEAAGQWRTMDEILVLMRRRGRNARRYSDVFNGLVDAGLCERTSERPIRYRLRAEEK